MKDGGHACANGCRMIGVHAAVEQQQARRSGGIYRAQDGPDIAWILWCDDGYKPGMLFGRQFVQLCPSLSRNGQQALGVVSGRNRAHDLGRRPVNRDFLRVRLSNESATKVACQQVGRINEIVHSAGGQRLSRVKYSLNDAQGGRLTFAVPGERANLLDAGVGGAGDEGCRCHLGSRGNMARSWRPRATVRAGSRPERARLCSGSP